MLHKDVRRHGWPHFVLHHYSGTGWDPLAGIHFLSYHLNAVCNKNSNPLRLIVDVCQQHLRVNPEESPINFHLESSFHPGCSQSGWKFQSWDACYFWLCNPSFGHLKTEVGFILVILLPQLETQILQNALSTLGEGGHKTSFVDTKLWAGPLHQRLNWRCLFLLTTECQVCALLVSRVGYRLRGSVVSAISEETASTFCLSWTCEHRPAFLYSSCASTICFSASLTHGTLLKPSSTWKANV